MTIDLKSLVRTIPDYPKKGILFRDITTLIENPAGFRESVERIASVYRGMGITHVAGIEARGFIFGAGVAMSLGAGFVPVRKSGKLPGETIGQNYALEYGVDTIEIHADVVGADDHVLVVDDLIATGGTAIAAVALLRRTGAAVEHAAFVIDLPDLGGAGKLRAEAIEVNSLMTFDGD
ncbi:adenine phosphoribosyltransferase [Mariluticola halotolerans]|uniref:adenine phosphoribosyltransferase n=1 Tax=Mariluticola halotolerans TaxID=2909283 RepID=UPI0026E1FF19|nr:adenine phosphoribosyltransferase [Mariluticola halotolerans]UJQ94416.1 adenine phosphoribosyltransferase [Mariluticola halotolerans]